MTSDDLLLCVLSFAAGYLLKWALTRHQIAQAERRAELSMLSRAQRSRDFLADIRRGEGAEL